MNRPTPSIDEVFFAAMERESPEARAAYLDEVCGSDLDLRRRVERLLDNQPKVGRFLDAPAAGPTVTLTPPRATEGPGTVIGPYKLLEQIGEGGMGIVYMAEQTQPVRRKVALKIIKPGMDTKQVIARFEAERQALAMMDHPNIAKVLDAGATESGRSYFVMELVRGIPITEYCDQHRLPIPERLNLFTQVCQAVQHAHQKGIIHRDIKPTNVLVTSLDGVPLPRVIDFGIAKATGQSLTDKTLFTGFAQLIGTPLYMSPEQAELSTVDIDTRSDIYSLGVLLYELLTGTTPFDQDTFRTAALDEVRRIIREDEPPKPSTRLSESKDTLPSISARRHTEPVRLTKLLRGELDWIVMKALEKDRRRRYDTASGLARDVERYLAGDPVEAGPPSGWYRLRKFTRRNRLVLTTTVLVALALIAGTTVSAWQAILTRRARADAIVQRDRARKAEADALAQRDRAETNFRRARDAVDQMLTEVGEKALAEIPQAEPVRRALLEKAAAFYRDFLGEHAADPALRGETARAYSRLGALEGDLGHFPDAARAFQQQIALLQELLKDDPENVQGLRDLIWAHLRLAIHRRSIGDLGAAVLESGRANEIAQALALRFPGRRDDRKWLARTLDVHAVMLWQSGKLLEAFEPLRRAVEIYEQVIRENAADVRRGDLAGALNNLSILSRSQGKNAEAVDLLERAIAHQKEALKAEPKSVVARVFLRNQYENLAIALNALGKPNESLQAGSQIIAMGEALMTDYPARPGYRHDLAKSYHNLANIQRDSGRTPEAEASYRRAIELDQKLADEFPNVPSYQIVGAQSSLMLGDLLKITSRPSAARDAYRRSLEGYERIAAKFPEITDSRIRVADAANVLAWFLLTCADLPMRDTAEALKLAKRAVELESENAGFCKTLGLARYRCGAWGTAIEAVQKSMALPHPAGGQPMLAVAAIADVRESVALQASSDASARLILAMAHWRVGRKDEASRWYIQAVDGMEKNKLQHADLNRLRAEAAALLGITDHPTSSGKKEENTTRQSKP
ncbi:MAG: protein kinase [Isosphaerales bacterium]